MIPIVPSYDTSTCSGNSYSYASVPIPGYAMHSTSASSGGYSNVLLGACMQRSYNSATKAFVFALNTCANQPAPAANGLYQAVLTSAGVIGLCIGVILVSMICCGIFFLLGRRGRQGDEQSLTKNRDTIPDVHKI